MSAQHTMARTDGNDTESLFTCPAAGCGRRLVLDHVGGRIRVLDEGNRNALHQGATGPISFAGDLDGERP